MADAPKDDMDDIVPAKKSKLVPLLLVTNTLLVAGVLAFTLTRKSGPPPAQAADEGEHEAKEEPAHGGAEKEGGKYKGSGSLGPTVRLENFVVQLRAVESERYAHLSMEVEVATEPDKDRVGQALPRIRDSVIGYLADRTADELRGSDGMGKLKDAVIERLREIVGERRIVNVFVTDFIVQ